MIITTDADRREAEKIILGQSRLYSLGISLSCNGKPNRRVEAALIDLLLSHDNEGGRVVLLARPSEATNAVRQRYFDLREHVDPDFVRKGFDDYRQARTEYENFRKGSPFRKLFDVKEIFREGSICEPFEIGLIRMQRGLQENPALRLLNGREDNNRDFDAMLLEAGYTEEEIHKSIGSFSELASYYEYKYGAEDARVQSYNWLPLLRESERRRMTLEVRKIMSDLTPEEGTEFLVRYPHVGADYKAYLDALSDMRREFHALEARLAGQFVSKKSDAELRQSNDFDKVAGISLWVDPNLTELVRKILIDTQEPERRALREEKHVLSFSIN